jgi:hypothetical protein
MKDIDMKDIDMKDIDMKDIDMKDIDVNNDKCGWRLQYTRRVMWKSQSGMYTTTYKFYH